MRLALVLVQRESLRAQPGQPPPAARVLATAALEWLDARDGEWWPFVTLPPLWLDPGAAGAVGLQLGAVEGGGLVVEVGLDLGRYLADVSGLQPRAGGEAALFRFPLQAEDLVR